MLYSVWFHCSFVHFKIHTVSSKHNFIRNIKYDGELIFKRNIQCIPEHRPIYYVQHIQCEFNLSSRSHSKCCYNNLTAINPIPCPPPIRTPLHTPTGQHSTTFRPLHEQNIYSINRKKQYYPFTLTAKHRHVKLFCDYSNVL